jgi:hypothetical protein
MIPEGYCQCGCGGKTSLATRNDKRIGWVKGKPLRFINNHHGSFAVHKKYDGGPGYIPPTGYCECGCGQKTKIAKCGSAEDGYVLGQPRRFVKGHNGRGSGNGMYKGGECFDKRAGRWLADRGDGVFILRSRVAMQKHMGRELDRNEIVHHRNKNPLDDNLENLEVMSRADHARLHAQMRRVGEADVALQL